MNGQSTYFVPLATLIIGIFIGRAFSPEGISNKANNSVSEELLVAPKELGAEAEPEVTPQGYAKTESNKAAPMVAVLKPNMAEPVETPEKDPDENPENLPPEAKPLTAELVQNESDLHKFLKSKEVPDIYEQLKSSKLLNRRQVKKLNGRFFGTVTFDDSKKTPWDIELMFFGQKKSGKYIGEHEIRMSKDGKTFSHSTGGIRDDDYRSIGENPSAIIINAYGDSGFFQLYYSDEDDRFYGLVYLKESFGKFRREGFVQLTRR